MPDKANDLHVDNNIKNSNKVQKKVKCLSSYLYYFTVSLSASRRDMQKVPGSIHPRNRMQLLRHRQVWILQVSKILNKQVADRVAFR